MFSSPPNYSNTVGISHALTGYKQAEFSTQIIKWKDLPTGLQLGIPQGNLVQLVRLPTGKYSKYLSLAGMDTKDASLVCLSVVQAKLPPHFAFLVKVAVDSAKPDDTLFPTAKASKDSEPNKVFESTFNQSDSSLEAAGTQTCPAFL